MGGFWGDTLTQMFILWGKRQRSQGRAVPQIPRAPGAPAQEQGHPGATLSLFHTGNSLPWPPVPLSHPISFSSSPPEDFIPHPAGIQLSTAEETRYGATLALVKPGLVKPGSSCRREQGIVPPCSWNLCPRSPSSSSQSRHKGWLCALIKNTSQVN